MSKPVTPSLALKRHLKASPEKVFKAWTRAEALTRWFGPGEVRVVKTETDLKVGGRYRIEMKSPDGEDHKVGGTYKEIVTNKRLVFSWAWDATPERVSQVTVTFAARDGGTDLTLLHEQFCDETVRAHHEQGWTGCLAKLEAYFPDA